MDVSILGLFSVLGAGIAIGLGSIGSALGEGYIAMKAVESLGRQPGASGKILRIMIIGQAITETAAIFALIISLILIFREDANTVTKAVSALASGLAIGLGSIGSGVGAGLPGATAMQGIAKQPGNSDAITINMIVGQAITQTSTIFALTVALLLAFIVPTENSIVKTFAVLGAGLAMGFGAFGPGVGDGIVARNANKGVAKDPYHASLITRSMIIGQAITETTDIYSIVVALILIFVA